MTQNMILMWRCVWWMMWTHQMALIERAMWMWQRMVTMKMRKIRSRKMKTRTMKSRRMRMRRRIRMRGGCG
jgi:hypothetical protein